jgi:hypothetical protein
LLLCFSCYFLLQYERQRKRNPLPASSPQDQAILNAYLVQVFYTRPLHDFIHLFQFIPFEPPSLHRILIPLLFHAACILRWRCWRRFCSSPDETTERTLGPR